MRAHTPIHRYYYVHGDGEFWKNGKEKTDLRYWDQPKAQARWEETVNMVWNANGRTNLEMYRDNAGPQFTSVFYKYS